MADLDLSGRVWRAGYGVDDVCSVSNLHKSGKRDWRFHWNVRSPWNLDRWKRFDFVVDGLKLWVEHRRRKDTQWSVYQVVSGVGGNSKIRNIPRRVINCLQSVPKISLHTRAITALSFLTREDNQSQTFHILHLPHKHVYQTVHSRVRCVHAVNVPVPVR